MALSNGKVAFGGSLGFGIERIGLIAARNPVAALIVVAIVTAFAVAGAARLQSGGLVLSLLRSDTLEFRTFERLREEFGASDRAVHAIIAGKDILIRERIEQLRKLHVEFQLAEPVDNVLSIFSVPDAPQPDGYAPPLFPDELPDGAAFETLKRQVLGHPLVRDRLFTQTPAGRQATLFVITLRPEANTIARQRASLQAIETLARDYLSDAGLVFQLLGTPVMEAETRKNTDRDRLLFNGVGLFIGMLVCLAFFRRLRPVAILTTASFTALVWSLGMLGWFDVKVSALLNAILPLVLVITFCDSMHLLFALRRRIHAGDGPHQAARHAIVTVGPACVLTSLTTATALLSLTLADSEVVDTFGWTAALATLMALFVVLMLVPALSVLFLRVDAGASTSGKIELAGAEFALDRICTRLAALVERHARRISVVAIFATFALTAVHLQLRPEFRLSDQASDQMRARLDASAEYGALALAFPIEIVVRPRSRTPAEAATTRPVVNAVATALEAQPLVRKVWSIELIRNWLQDKRIAPKTIDAFMRKLPDDLKRRFYNDDTGALLVTGYLPDLNADATLRLLAALDTKVADIRTHYPEYEITVTGLSVLSAQQSTRMIDQLNAGLFAAIALVLLLLGLAFRSALVPLYSLVPNFLPLVATGAVLAATGRGLDYASVIALTVAFGIAVDNAIHFLNRLQLESQRAPNMAVAATAAMQRIGPVLIATTVILIFGVVATLFSAVPPTRTFGLLFMTTLTTALLADLIILPALILAGRRHFGKPKA